MANPFVLRKDRLPLNVTKERDSPDLLQARRRLLTFIAPKMRQDEQIQFEALLDRFEAICRQAGKDGAA